MNQNIMTTCLIRRPSSTCCQNTPTRQGVGSTRPLKVSCGTCQQDISSRSFNACKWRGILVVPDARSVEIWGIWRPSQHLELLVTFLKPFPNGVRGVAGCINLLKEAATIRTIAMKRCTWSTAMFRQVVRVKLMSTSGLRAHHRPSCQWS